ncbi:putative membrane-associated kinase regulator 1 [Dorcoceras hygrometricum]|uniref:Putative membrane-associated kinase regulator 1 n=1 Tax=Dorcoceras hygrometricum TaxID=472368 RepID=A0A2Z7C4J8_9LAMI|nr:putative membrane-associated kinase regulator 1 [Dorcoceras hygrometricum]
MGRRSQTHRHSATKSHTLPSSPTHSSSSSDFEFATSLSPHKSAAALCPADELFYKGQLLPLQLSPRLSMVRTLLLSSPSTSSASDTTTTASRDSTASHSSDSSSTDLLYHHDCDSSRPSSVADDEFKRLTTTTTINLNPFNFHTRKSSKYFSLSKFSSVFRKEHKNPTTASSGGAAAVKRVSSSAKDVIRRYIRKVKPLYEKLSHKQQQQHQHQQRMPPPPSSKTRKDDKYHEATTRSNFPPQNISFSGNLVYPRRRSSISSCPSSIGSSPTHGRNGFGFSKMGRAGSGMCHSDASSMEELQNAIQSAITHCKNSMLQNKNSISNEI